MVTLKQANKGIIRFTEYMRRDSEILALIFREFRPLKFDLDLNTGTYYMLCESDMFLDVKDGERIMNYDITMTRENGEVFITDVNPY